MAVGLSAPAWSLLLEAREYVVELPEAPNFWAFSDVELAQSCKLVAEGRSGPANAPVRAEAMRLFLLWVEALQSPDRVGDDRVRRHFLISGLRKRTIQVLVRLSLQGLLPTLEA